MELLVHFIPQKMVTLTQQVQQMQWLKELEMVVLKYTEIIE